VPHPFLGRKIKQPDSNCIPARAIINNKTLLDFLSIFANILWNLIPNCIGSAILKIPNLAELYV
jgi:hypothetical protein